MRDSISDTAECGDLTRGPRIIIDESHAEIRGTGKARPRDVSGG